MIHDVFLVIFINESIFCLRKFLHHKAYQVRVQNYECLSQILPNS